MSALEYLLNSTGNSFSKINILALTQIGYDAILFMFNIPVQIILYIFSRYLYTQGKGIYLGRAAAITLLTSTIIFTILDNLINVNNKATMHLFNFFAYYLLIYLAMRAINVENENPFIPPKHSLVVGMISICFCFYLTTIQVAN